MNTLEPLANGLPSFVSFDLANVAATADAFNAQLSSLLNYPTHPPPGDHGDKRGAVNATMDYLHQFADPGVAVIVVSAIGRSKNERGNSTYAGDGLNLALFRESSELEFGCDDAFILTTDDDDQGEAVTLRHLKSRQASAGAYRADVPPPAPALHAGRGQLGTVGGRRESENRPSPPLGPGPRLPLTKKGVGMIDRNGIPGAGHYPRGRGPPLLSDELKPCRVTSWMTRQRQLTDGRLRRCRAERWKRVRGWGTRRGARRSGRLAHSPTLPDGTKTPVLIGARRPFVLQHLVAGLTRLGSRRSC